MTFDLDVAIGAFILATVAIFGAAIGVRFLAQRLASSALPSTAEPAPRDAEVDVVDGRAVVASGFGMGVAQVSERRLTKPEVAARNTQPSATATGQRTPLAATTATEDSGGEVRRVPASEAEATGPTEALTTQPREDPASSVATWGPQL